MDEYTSRAKDLYDQIQNAQEDKRRVLRLIDGCNRQVLLLDETIAHLERQLKKLLEEE